LKKGDEKEEELRIALLDLDNLIRKHKENPRIFSDLLALRGIAQYHRGNTEEAIEHMKDAYEKSRKVQGICFRPPR